MLARKQAERPTEHVDEMVPNDEAAAAELPAAAADDADLFPPRKTTSIQPEHREGQIKAGKGHREPGNEDDETAGETSATMSKLSRSQIEKGQAVLEEIATVLEARASQLERLSSQFFTLVPSFGGATPVPITTMELVREKGATLKYLLRMGFFEEVDGNDKEQVPPAARTDRRQTEDETFMSAPPSASMNETLTNAPTAAPAGERRLPVDREVPNREKYRVVGDWDCTLNQTNVGANNNKFYIIQVLVDDKDNHYCWNRWGRVGEPGQNALHNCGSFAAACSNFEKKFKDKTTNNWSNRDSFVKKDGKYGLVEKEIEEGDGGSGEASAPMGKLSRSQIEKGQAVLEEIAKVLETNPKNKSSELERLSSQFFTLIPTNFGRMKPVPITTIEQVNEKDATLKFFLRMGFEEVETKDDGKTPLAGLMDLPLPKSLAESIAGACPISSVNQSVSKGDTLAKTKAGKPVRPMTKDEYGSILLYTSNAIYRELNRVLREEDKKGIKKFISYLRLLLHSAAGLPTKPAQLYRGIGVDLSQQYKEGTTITWWGVSSCTSELQVAKNFAHGCSGESSLLTLDTKTACDISAISFYSNEKESLLMPGTQLRVKSCKKNGKVAEIHLEEIGRAV